MTAKNFLANFVGKYFAKPDYITLSIAGDSIFRDAAVCDKIRQYSDFKLQVQFTATAKAAKKARYVKAPHYNWALMYLKEEMKLRKEQHLAPEKTYSIKIKRNP